MPRTAGRGGFYSFTRSGEGTVGSRERSVSLFGELFETPGASGFLAEMMMNCTDEFWNKTGSNKTFKECRDEAMAALERLRGKRVKPEARINVHEYTQS